MHGLQELAPRLHQFVAVARAEHMTRAAARIGVPQPTLSRAMRRLEDDVGVALFARGGRALRLTPAGRTLLTRAEAALAELAAAADELSGDADAASGRVTLGFLATLGTDAVPRLLRGFRDTHPGVRIELLQGRHADLLERLRDGTADVVLSSPLPDEPGLVATALVEEQVRLAVPTGHRMHRTDRTGAPEPVALADVAEEPFLAFAPGYGLRGPVHEWFRAAGVTPSVAFEGGDVATLRGLVGAGLGVALLPMAADVPGVAQVPVHSPRPTRTIGMICRRGDRPTPAAAALRGYVVARAPDALAHD